ncbi:Cysteine-rich receptor-like protein kinase 26 [Abeliophyllum distichum]|uniref:Cysteine-rich receptor-like protein kinase 26 n=1 Tax=Abeliophyllum distichum TaxID=126358 RepID=A0ABD1NSD1_9LAMI
MNLHNLFSYVSSNIDNNGFYNASKGQNSDRVNIIALCRADLQPYQCRDYVANATVELLKACPYQKEAVFWHEFCMVRYSNEAIYGTVAIFPYEHAQRMESVLDSEKFYKELNILLDSLRNQTAYNSLPKKFGAGSRPDPNFRTIYAFEQCTPDITPEDCGACLTQSALIIPQCCGGARGVRILRPSCYLRYETDPFYNDTMVRTIQQVPTQPIVPVPGALGKDVIT